MTFLPAEHSHKERAVLSNGSTHRKHCSFIVPLCSTNANLSGQSPSICSRRPFGHLKAPLGFHCFANANFTYLDNGNVNFPDNKKYSRSKPTIIRIPPTTLMPIRLTLLFFIILFAKTNSSAPTTIIKTDINGYMSFLLSNSDLLNQDEYTTLSHERTGGYSTKIAMMIPCLWSLLFGVSVRTFVGLRWCSCWRASAPKPAGTEYGKLELVGAKPHWGFHCSASLHKREVIWLMPFYQSAMIS